MKYTLATLSLLLFAGWGMRQWTPATFTIRNESGRVIRSLTVEVGGKTFQYEDIPVGGEATGSFHISQEETFNVHGRFGDGAEFFDCCGYVVWEDFAPRTNIVVRAGGEAIVHR